MTTAETTTQFQKTMALQAYKSWLEQAAHTRKWLLQNGFKADLEAIETTGTDAEDLLIKNQELILEIHDLQRHLASVRKLCYTTATQNQPSTGQPMTEQTFYEIMGWTERDHNVRGSECK